MCARWKSNFEPGPLVQRLQELRVVSEETEETRFGSDPFFEDILLVLESAVEISPEIPEYDARRIFSRALWDAAAAGPLDPRSLLGRLSRLENEWLGQPWGHFVLVTTVSVRYFDGFAEACGVPGDEEHSVRFERWLPPEFRDGHDAARRRAERYVHGDLPDLGLIEQTPALVSVRGRSKHEAAQRAIDALDLLRGTWNLTLNRHRRMRMTNAARKPVNPVLLGPIQSLHRPDGELVTYGHPAFPAVWYQHDYLGPVTDRQLRRRWETVRRQQKRIDKQLENHAYAPEQKEAIRRYCRTLDTHEWDVSFIELWSLLEHLTATGEGEGYGETIRRTAFLYEASERSIHEHVLEHLRRYRNRRVHAGEESEDVERYLYQLKRYAEDLLGFHLANPAEADSVKSAARMLDLPADPSRLEQRRRAQERKVDDLREDLRLIEHARRFHAD